MDFSESYKCSVGPQCVLPHAPQLSAHPPAAVCVAGLPRAPPHGQRAADTRAHMPRPARCAPCYSPDGKYLATAVEYRLIIRDVESLRVVQLYSCLDRIDRLEWADNSLYVLCAMYARAILQVRAVQHAHARSACLPACPPGTPPAACQQRASNHGARAAALLHCRCGRWTSRTGRARSMRGPRASRTRCGRPTGSASCAWRSSPSAPPSGPSPTGGARTCAAPSTRTGASRSRPADRRWQCWRWGVRVCLHACATCRMSCACVCRHAGSHRRCFTVMRLRRHCLAVHRALRPRVAS